MVERIINTLSFWLVGFIVGFSIAWFSNRSYPISTIITIAILLFIIQVAMFFKLWVTR